MEWYGFLWNGMVFYDLVWYDMVWFGMVFYEMVWSSMIWFGMIRYGMAIARAMAMVVLRCETD